MIALWHSRRLAPLASRGCAALLVLQFVSALSVALAGQQSLSVLLDKAELHKDEPAPELWDFSKNQNVVLIILDSLQSDAVDTLHQTEQEWFDRDYAGFVFFRDNAGSFPTTKASLPAIMTGAVYRNEMPLMDFIRQAEKRASIFELFHEHGYRTDLAGITNLLIGTEPSTRFDIPLPYGSTTERIQSEVLRLVDLSLFRFGFHGIKAWVYADRGWRLRRLQSHPERVHHAGNGDAFLLDFAARAVATREEPVFKLIHTGGIHPPFIRGPDCEFSGVVPTNRETLIDQSRCSLRVLARLLDRMRELGIYQESLIVVSSDHGVGVSVARLPGDTRKDRRFSLLAGKALALLMVKPAGRIGPVEVSEAPSFIGDIPATIFEQLGWEHNFPGISAFAHAEGAKRKRQFASYPWTQADWKAPYLRKLVVYDIDGPVRKSLSWRLNRIIMAPDFFDGARDRGPQD
ncbi:MAG: sulfatase-like hydrolase/transferase [Planctomycetes bacterium]|nr:sulfatase-like hydrolase/transferase [Planctomycetota bacterium]